ncbi:MAG: hypothetical protein K0S56_257 [Microvirga sp.]|jgi:hypothetical protein|nr:hypothetical protein [Microvirga sp.]
MTDATPNAPVLTLLSYEGRMVRATRHPVHGRMLMAWDVLNASGHTVKTAGTRPILAGLQVPERSRIVLKGEDFDTSPGKAKPTFQNATFLTREGLDQIAGYSSKKDAKAFGRWMAKVMDNGVPVQTRPQDVPRAEPAATPVAKGGDHASRTPAREPRETPPVPPEGLPWEE